MDLRIMRKDELRAERIRLYVVPGGGNPCKALSDGGWGKHRRRGRAPLHGAVTSIFQRLFNAAPVVLAMSGGEGETTLAATSTPRARAAAPTLSTPTVVAQKTSEPPSPALPTHSPCSVNQLMAMTSAGLDEGRIQAACQ